MRNIEVIIREPQEADLPELIAMYNKSWVETYSGMQAGATEGYLKNEAARRLHGEGWQKQLKKLQTAQNNPGKYLYRIAQVDNMIVGFLYAYCDEKHIELDRLYVDSRYQGKGVSDELIKRFFDWCEDKSAKVSLSVVSGNDHAEHFYERHGFIRIADSAHVYPGGILEVFDMERKGK